MEKKVTSAEFGVFLQALGKLMVERNMGMEQIYDELPSGLITLEMVKFGLDATRADEIIEECFVDLVC